MERKREKYTPSALAICSKSFPFLFLFLSPESRESTSAKVAAYARSLPPSTPFSKVSTSTAHSQRHPYNCSSPTQDAWVQNVSFSAQAGWPPPLFLVWCDSDFGWRALSGEECNSGDILKRASHPDITCSGAIFDFVFFTIYSWFLLVCCTFLLALYPFFFFFTFFCSEIVQSFYCVVKTHREISCDWPRFLAKYYNHTKLHLRT